MISEEIRKYSFNPIVNNLSEAIILGTLPWDESIFQNRYYEKENSQFWILIYSAYNSSIDSNYKLKCEFLLKNGIAIWDVLQSENLGRSSDNNILLEETNDFIDFFAKYPNIKIIFFNGREAKNLFKKYFDGLFKFKALITLPSSIATSGINEYSLEEKKNAWSMIPFMKENHRD